MSGAAAILSRKRRETEKCIKRQLFSCPLIWNHVKFLKMSHLHEDDYGDDGIADGEDAPQHPDGLAVAHELVGVVVRRLPVFQLRLHTDP